MTMINESEVGDRIENPLVSERLAGSSFFVWSFWVLVLGMDDVWMGYGEGVLVGECY